jgi:hypothetical protein
MTLSRFVERHLWNRAPWLKIDSDCVQSSSNVYLLVGRARFSPLYLAPVIAFGCISKSANMSSLDFQTVWPFGPNSIVNTASSIFGFVSLLFFYEALVAKKLVRTSAATGLRNIRY